MYLKNVINNPMYYFKNPLFYLKYLLRRIFIKYKVNVEGVQFYVKYKPPWEQVNSGTWEPNTFRIFNTFLDANYSFIDLGAWIGITTMYGSKIAKKCYSIEPDPLAYTELKRNVAMNPSWDCYIVS